MEKGFAYTCLQLLFLAVLIEKGNCIKCYVCSSSNDPNCYDPIASKMTLAECSADLASTSLRRFQSLTGSSDISNFFNNLVQGGSFTCSKLEVMLPNNANTTVIRGCQFERDPSDDICKILSMKLQGKSFIKFCEICNSDACNSAYTFVSSSMLSLLVPAIATLFYIRV